MASEKQQNLYKVIIDSRAEEDMYEIFDYIFDVLKSPIAAKNLFTEIKDQMSSLSIQPERCTFVSDAQFRYRGIHKLFVKNYIIFFVIDYDKDEVHVIRILYNRRNWGKIL
jgi:plasmid stabilization system protein ParE